MDDLTAVEETVLRQGEFYFRDILSRSPDDIRTVLEKLAYDRPVEVSPQQQRWLRHRCLLTSDCRLRISILGRWGARERWEH